MDQNERRKKYEEIHAKIKSSSNKKILRQQLELLAEHSRICGIDQIPECSEAMVRVAQELNHGIRETILFALLTFGVSFYLLYSLRTCIHNQGMPDGRGILLPCEAKKRRQYFVYCKIFQRGRPAKDPLRRYQMVVNTGS